MKLTILLILTIGLTTISRAGLVTNEMGMVSVNGSPPKRTTRFTVNCPHCRMIYKGQVPLLITTNGWHSTNGGNIAERVIDFRCPNGGCQETIRAKNTLFVPEAVAVEEEPTVPPDQLPGAPTPGASVLPTWTTNANLRLSIEIFNKTNVFTLTGVTNGSTMSNTVTLGVTPIPMAAIRFPTELGKSYKCQASDDAKKTWLDGPVVAGTGHSITNYEMPVKMSRIYRVVENPL